MDKCGGFGNYWGIHCLKGSRDLSIISPAHCCMRARYINMRSDKVSRRIFLSTVMDGVYGTNSSFCVGWRTRGGGLWGGVNFYCHEFLASVGKISFLGVRMGASKVLSCLACCDATCIYQFIINNQVSFHLWSKENLVKHQKVSKYFDHG